jgi:glycosyltransferase involved in cell wall biosynthesis
MLSLANEFAARGLAIDLLLRQKIGPLVDEVSPEVRIIDFSSRRLTTILPQFRKYLRTTQPVALLSAMSNANVIACLAWKLAASEARLVVSEHTSAREGQMAGVGGSSLLKQWRPFVYRWADAIVAVSRGVADDLVTQLALQRDRMAVIYNPVFQPAFDERMTEATGNEWFDQADVPVILSVGRLSAVKAHEVLIKAFSVVRRTHLARLVILGEGPERGNLEKLVDELDLRDVVRLPGFRTNPLSWMAKSKLFVLSSRWEGFGNVLVEAMACRIPVVATDCPSGPREILENGKWGRLVPVDSIEALAQAIISSLDHPLVVDPRDRAVQFSNLCTSGV